MHNVHASSDLDAIRPAIHRRFSLVGPHCAHGINGAHREKVTLSGAPSDVVERNAYVSFRADFRMRMHIAIHIAIRITITIGTIQYPISLEAVPDAIVFPRNGNDRCHFAA